ncbi:MAG: bphP [Verrucomicrobiales bacterium]|nr:bphP [Verrucomicrobiales bacterium]
MEDVIRFNEAIDQALCESISFFSDQTTRSRNLLLGMLGHDMRSPLNAIVLTAEHLAELNAGEEVSEAALCLINSGAAMKGLLDDLVDFSRRKLGLGIVIEPAAMDLGELCANELRQHRAAHPGSRTELTLEGNLHGHWDALRLRQVLRNLLSNASAYGDPGEPVRVVVCGDENGVRLEVRNTGTPIEPAAVQDLFEPLRRAVPPEKRANGNGLGLGLYIVREITRAHGGEVEVQSGGTETAFSVRLPRVSGGPDAQTGK